ncbi:class I SAM-dependent methyltransferase [Pseudoclavibacter terrae]|uniref:class I SAM-dependent methyltransferase n=1 Tax=Pseudoclavibacter terrae TaxID=1530195 RepID=UPI00232AF35F|nr:methyltransferase domain-containing protein [Pseudoclavibacter terrae]
MNGSPDAQVRAWRGAHANAQMTGWNFSSLDGRLTTDDPPWDFDAECRAATTTAKSVADLGTGGGERLIELIRSMPSNASPLQIAATEGWEPNVAVARENLAPFGVGVHAHDIESGEPLPFADSSLDLIVARHEEFDASEVARVLVSGGRFLTQQVDGRDAHELRDWFGGEPLYEHVTLANAVSALRAEGLRVEVAEEWAGRMTFADSLTLVEYLALVPWDVPGFSVDSNVEQLRQLDAARPITVTQRRFRLTAVRD